MNVHIDMYFRDFIQMTEIYIVYIYCDSHNDFNIQHLRAFQSREDAIEFAKKYSDENSSNSDFVRIKGTEYDEPFYGESVSYDDVDNEIECRVKQIREELCIKQNMFCLRIAVDKVFLKTD